MPSSRGYVPTNVFCLNSASILKRGELVGIIYKSWASRVAQQHRIRLQCRSHRRHRFIPCQEDPL